MHRVTVLCALLPKRYKWDLNYGGIALMWRGGCIIRSVFLNKIKDAFDHNHELANLLLDPFFTATIEKSQNGWRQVVATAQLNGIPVPTLVNCPELLRWVPDRIPACKPVAGTARLFRRPHLRTIRSAPWKILPHQLDRTWWRYCRHQLIMCKLFKMILSV